MRGTLPPTPLPRCVAYLANCSLTLLRKCEAEPPMNALRVMSLTAAVMLCVAVAGATFTFLGNGGCRDANGKFPSRYGEWGESFDESWCQVSNQPALPWLFQARPFLTFAYPHAGRRCA